MGANQAEGLGQHQRLLLQISAVEPAADPAADPADDPADDPAADSAADSVCHTLQAIYSRYKAAREAWYEEKRLVPSAMTKKVYRKAHNLPMRLTDSERAWCLSSSQMGDKSQWREEEMMRGRISTNVETVRTDNDMRKRMAAEDFRNPHHGLGAIWDDAAIDIAVQTQRYGTGRLG